MDWPPPSAIDFGDSSSFCHDAWMYSSFQGIQVWPQC
jgi:hypothetical protein